MVMQSTVAEAARLGRGEGLDALAVTLVDAIGKADDAQVPALAGRLVDVLRRIGGDDPSVLFWLRDGLAVAVDRLAGLQGEHTPQGRALGTELASMVRQLVDVLEAIAALPPGVRSVPAEVVTIDDAKRLRAARQQSASEVAAVAAKGGRKRR